MSVTCEWWIIIIALLD